MDNDLWHSNKMSVTEKGFISRISVKVCSIFFIHLVRLCFNRTFNVLYFYIIFHDFLCLNVSDIFFTRIIVILITILLCACCVYDVLVSFGFCSYICHINFWLIRYQYESIALFFPSIQSYLVCHLSNTIWYIHSFNVHKGVFISTIAVDYPCSFLWQAKTRIC